MELTSTSAFSLAKIKNDLHIVKLVVILVGWLLLTLLSFCQASTTYLSGLLPTLFPSPVLMVKRVVFTAYEHMRSSWLISWLIRSSVLKLP